MNVYLKSKNNENKIFFLHCEKFRESVCKLLDSYNYWSEQFYSIHCEIYHNFMIDIKNL